jgi:hypothetical protein
MEELIKVLEDCIKDLESRKKNVTFLRELIIETRISTLEHVINYCKGVSSEIESLDSRKTISETFKHD